MDLKKTSVPRPTFAADGASFREFSNARMLMLMVLAPIALTFLLSLSLLYLPLVMLLTAFPVFAIYNMFVVASLSHVGSHVLPNKPRSHYLEFLTDDLKRFNTEKIPIETWFEAYFDLKLNVNLDMLEMLEARYLKLT